MNSKSTRFRLPLWFAGIALLAGLIAAAAFTAGKLLSRPQGLQPGQDLIAAAELPPPPPDAIGLFIRREDNSIFVGTGGINIDSEVDGVPVLTFEGPVVEVIVNSETEIYREVTDYSEALPSGEVQQKVATGTMDDLNEAMRISVWGRETGDRIIATVLLYGEVFPFAGGRAPQIESP